MSCIVAISVELHSKVVYGAIEKKAAYPVDLSLAQTNRRIRHYGKA